jgi:uncharacterized protein with GYD domain
MFTYVALLKLTPEGREGIKEAPKHLAQLTKIVEAEKGKVERVLAMMGPYDFISILEYPTVEAAFKAHGRIAALDVVEAETFPVEEIEVFLKALV